jgi:hypothetical protein
VVVGSRKYFQEASGAAEGRTLFYGAQAREDGIPLELPVGASPMLKREELETLDTVATFQAQTFRSWEPDDEKAYVTIMDKIVNGARYNLYHHERQFNAAEAGWIIRVEWFTTTTRLNTKEAMRRDSW